MNIFTKLCILFCQIRDKSHSFIDDNFNLLFLVNYIMTENYLSCISFASFSRRYLSKSANSLHVCTYTACLYCNREDGISCVDISLLVLNKGTR